MAVLSAGCNEPDHTATTDPGPEKPVTNDAAKTEAIFSDPFRDINNFGAGLGHNLVLDSMNAVWPADPAVSVTYKRDICNGDVCTSLKTMTNAREHKVFHFFKSDAGEYGFSNDQFVLRNDSLLIVRKFNAGIEEWATDSTETVWVCEDSAYYFASGRVMLAVKRSHAADLFEYDFALTEIPAATRTIADSTVHRRLFSEMMDLLKRERSD